MNLKTIIPIILLFAISCSSDYNYIEEVKGVKEVKEDPVITERYIPPVMAMKGSPELMEVEELQEVEVVEEIDISIASFAMYCPTEMNVNEIYDVFGVFSLDLDLSEIEDYVLEIAAEHGNGKAPIVVDEVLVYEVIELRLIDPTNENFNITPIHDNNKQRIINGRVPENWHWKIRPLKVNRSQLILRLIIYDQELNIDHTLNRTYVVNTKVNRRLFISNFINYLYEHPTWLLTTVVIPLIMFLYKSYKNKRNKKKKDE